MDALPIGRIALVPLQGAPGRVAHGPRVDTAPIPFSGVDHARSQERQAPAHDVGALDDGWQGFHRAGWGAKTQWYRNILSDARVTVQSSGKPYGAIARRVTHDDELARLYEVIRGKSPVWGQYLDSWGVQDTVQDFVAKKDRLCILRLDPLDELPLPGIRTDLVCIWPAVVMLAMAVYFTVR